MGNEQCRFRQIILAQWPKRWWTTFDLGFLWDLEDDLLTEDTMTLGIEVGKQLSNRFAISAKPSFRVYGSADFVLAFELAFSYNLE